jgi:type I restriction enzyme, S subunit
MFGDPVTNPKGWPLKVLGDVADVAGGLQVTSARAGNPISMPYLRVANVYRDRLDLSEVKNIRVTEAERARATLKHGDVLVVEGHGNPEELGRAAVWRDEIAGCAHQNHLIRVRATPGILGPTFLSAFLNSSSGKKQMLVLGKTTSGLNTISTNNVRSVRIVVPPLERQVEYAEVVSGIGKLGGTMQRRGAGDESLFNALVARAFSGALEAAC